MKTTDTNTRPGRSAKVLSVLSLAGFWALPFAPIVSIGAVKTTEGTSGWARKAAVAGAVLTSVYTVALALLILEVYIRFAA